MVLQESLQVSVVCCLLFQSYGDSIVSISWWTIISAPWNAFIYRVEEGGETTKKALKNISEHAWQKDHYPFVAFNYTMLVIDIILGLVLFLFVFFFVRFFYRLVA